MKSEVGGIAPQPGGSQQPSFAAREAGRLPALHLLLALTSLVGWYSARLSQPQAAWIFIAQVTAWGGVCCGVGWGVLCGGVGPALQGLAARHELASPRPQQGFSAPLSRPVAVPLCSPQGSPPTALPRLTLQFGVPLALLAFVLACPAAYRRRAHLMTAALHVVLAGSSQVGTPAFFNLDASRG